MALAAKIADSHWILAPPVVERLGSGELVLIDGTHRLYERLLRRESDARCVVVDNRKVQLPAEPLASWGQVDVRTSALDRKQRYVNFREEHFRHLRSAYEEYFK